MPFGDRKGPLGQGPMTGRGAGFCAGVAVPGNMNAGFGGATGRGGRGGRGWRHQFCATGLTGWQRAATTRFATAPQEQEIAALKGQAEALQATLEQMRKRIEDMEARQTPK